MVLVTGGTGSLGREVVARLLALDVPVRVLTRDPARVPGPARGRVEVVRGDVRDPASVAAAVAGADTVVSAFHGFAGRDAGGTEAVDAGGNRTLVRAAAAAGVDHFVLVSIHGASPDHPMALVRAKYRAERDLRDSGLSWTILRPTAFMETWTRLLGEPLLRGRRAVVFGRGTNPINFVSARDVAACVERAVTDPALRGRAEEIGGPEDLGLRAFVAVFAAATGCRERVRHVPVAALRLAAAALRRLSPVLAGQVEAAVAMDREDFAFPDAARRAERFPDVPLTPLREMVRRDYVDGAVAAAVA